MCEPLSVGVHACRRAEVVPDMTVLVTGAGPIGLVMMLTARAFGASKVIITDIDEDRLAIASTLGGESSPSSSACTITTINVKDKLVRSKRQRPSYSCSPFSLISSHLTMFHPSTA